MDNMTSVLNDINSKLDSIHRSTVVLSDIVDRNIGLERVWPNRRAWTDDPGNAGMAAWKKRICQARTADIVSNTLWTGWFNDADFGEKFFENLGRGNTARILIYDPHAEVLRLRTGDEREPGGQMQAEIGWTLEVIARRRETLDDIARRNLQVRLTTHSYHLAQIIRADDHILVAVYLSGKTGGPSPTFQVRGPKTEYFQIFSEQIEILWQRGRPMSEGELPPVPGHRPPPKLSKLRQLLTKHFDDGELRDLCFDLHIEYDDLPGAGRKDKVRELVARCERHVRIPELVEECRRLRPNVSWEDILEDNR
jgi:hypothetical protein